MFRQWLILVLLLTLNGSAGFADIVLSTNEGPKLSDSNDVIGTYYHAKTPKTSLTQAPNENDQWITTEVDVSQDNEAHGILIETEPNCSHFDELSVSDEGQLKGRITLSNVTIQSKNYVHLIINTSNLKSDAYKFLISIPEDCNPKLHSNPVNIKTGDILFSSQEKATIPSVPQPVGQWRIPIERPSSLIRIPRSLLNIPSVEFDTLTVSHLEFDLPLIKSADEVIAYVPSFTSIYTTGTQLLLRADSVSNSLVMPTRTAFDSLTSNSSEVAIPRRRIFEEDNVYVRSMNQIAGRRFVFSHATNIPGFQGLPNSFTTQIPFNDTLSTPSVEAIFAMNSLSSSISFDPDHYALFTIEGEELDPISWEGNIPFTGVQTFDLPALTNGGYLDLVYEPWQDSPLTPAFALDSQMLDRVELRWTGYPKLDENKTGYLDILGSPSPSLVTVGGFQSTANSSNVVIIDFSTEELPVQITNYNLFTTSDTLKAIEFEALSQGGEFIAQQYDEIPIASEVFETKSLPDFNSNGTRLNRIYVRNEEFESTLQPLIDHRGAGSFELDPQAAYDTFGYGHTLPDAIRDAIASLYSLAPSKRSPLPVTMIGFSSPDPKNNTGLVTEPTIPIYIEEGVGFSFGNLEHTIDYDFGLLEGSDDFPEATIGRIIARDPQTLANVITRIIAYENQESNNLDPDRLGLFIADDELEFQNALTDWFDAYETIGRDAERIDVPVNNADDSPFRDQIINAFEAAKGRSLVLYTGHGNTINWSGQLLRSTDIEVLDTNNRWPIVVTFTCLNGYLGRPGDAPSLSEIWQSLPSDQGAVANIAPVGVDTFEKQREFTDSFMSPFEGNIENLPQTIGDLFYLGHIDHAARLPTRRTTRREFLLFGDPETKLFLTESSAIDSTVWMMH